MTAAVGADVADVVPPGFVAETVTRMVAPRSAEATLYCAVVAPVMSAQIEPSQRRHLYANDVGDPVHDPVDDWSVEPTWATPLITGTDVDVGAVVVGLGGWLLVEPFP